MLKLSCCLAVLAVLKVGPNLAGVIIAGLNAFSIVLTTLQGKELKKIGQDLKLRPGESRKRSADGMTQAGPVHEEE